MRLISAKITGFRRLADGCEIKLNTDPVCVVGPNAAGKSSLLDALEHLNHDGEFPAKDRTRVPQGAPMEPLVEARFELGDDDKALLADIPEAKLMTQFIVRKHADGGFSYLQRPKPERDLGPRERVNSLLLELGKSKWLKDVEQIEPSLDPAPEKHIQTLLQAALSVSGAENPSLGDDVNALIQIRERLREIDNERSRMETQRTAASEADPSGEEQDEAVSPLWPSLPRKYDGLMASLHDLIAYEELASPSERAEDELRNQVPEFVKFTALARNLDSEYDLANQELPAEGAAIHNLLALADTSWGEMLEVMQSGDPGRKEAYGETLNAELEERVALTWEASKLRVKARIDGTTLAILMSMQAHDYVTFDQHSDGLRQFVALRAFLAREGREISPIILIDEAETHLHYDAQADVVAVFEDQDDASQIIYTTHSAGCLPRDLGLAIRAIVPEIVEDEAGVEMSGDHSQVINRFWTEGRGYSPLLLAMGAGALAFSATQKAVVTEGMSDVILLPTLIREATGKDRLSYQAAPSFSEADHAQIRDLDLIAARVAFLADGDEGGRAHVKQLLENGVLAEQVRYLGDGESSGLSVEDLLHPELYLAAVNRELGTWHRLRYPDEDLPDTGRSKAVADWCKARSEKIGTKIKVSKVDVAQGILDARDPKKGLLDPRYRDGLVALDAEFEQIFKDAPSRVARLKQELTDARKALEQAGSVA